MESGIRTMFQSGSRTSESKEPVVRRRLGHSGGKAYPSPWKLTNTAALAGLLQLALATGLGTAAHLSAVKTRSGPSQASAICMAQDRRGFIWIGTQDGLNRFDGYDFKIYSRANSNGLRDNWIGALYAHPDGTLLIGNRHGLDRFDPSSEVFAPVDLGLAHRTDVRNIVVDPRGRAWISTLTDGLIRARLDGSGADFRTSFTDPGSGERCIRVNDVLLHSNGEAWILTSSAGIHVVNDDLYTLRVLASGLRNTDTDRPYPLSHAIETADGHVWLATGGAGLVKMDVTGAVLERHTWEDPRLNNLNTVMMDSQDRLWIGSWLGVTELWPESGRSRHNRPDPADPSRINDGLVNSLLEDRGGSVWVGTWTAGPYRYNPDSDRFRTYQGFFREAGNGHVENPVTTIVEDPDGRIWLTLNRQGRVLEFDPVDESFELLPLPQRRSERLGAMCAFEDELILGWSDGRVDRVNPRDGSFDVLSDSHPLLAKSLHEDIEIMRIDLRGWLWIGTRLSGAFAVDLASQDGAHYRPVQGDANGLAGPRVNDILAEPDGGIWLATSGGLQRLDLETGVFTTYAESPGSSVALPHNMVTTILRDRSGRLWLGTQGGGVALMTDDRDAGSFMVVDTSTGLGADAIGVLLEGADGGIWASTTRGMSRIDPSTLAVLNFVPADGVLDGGFFIGSGVASSRGELYFGGLKGMISVDSTFTSDAGGEPEVVLTSTLANGEALPSSSSEHGEATELAHTANVLTFEFTALSTRKPDLIRFAYRLVPFTNDWTEQSADRRFATFFNLPAGSYRFEVMAREPGGAWSHPTIYEFVKRPPWYQSRAAELLYWFALAALAFGAGSAVYRKRQRRREQRRKHELALQDLAYVDQLTRLPNRVQMERRLEDLLKEVVEHREIHVLFVDLDHFKDINDSLGHEIGDRVLRRVARRVSEAIGEDALVCRWGGDEFVALLEGWTLSQVERTAQSVIEELERPFSINSYEFIVTASVGIANASLKGTDSASVLRSAEAALYRAKQMGKSTWCVYDENVGKHTFDRVELARDLREAIAAKDIRVVYQPMYDNAGKIVAAEALARWSRNGSAEVAASRFIRVAEETGMILDLDRLVLATVMADAKDLLRRGLLSFRFSINMSALEFRRRDLAHRLLETLREADVTPDCIELEVTEGVVLSELENARSQIAELRSAGLTVAIDDFGTGFSALSYLTTLQVDRLKIDRGFVIRLDQGQVERAIVAGVIRIAADLGVEVVAEGVENSRQLEILQELGCAVFQGFHLAHPEPFERLVARLG